ncbi:xylulokinase [Compostimonas suwonensis]|uniref:Xylulokinase n=1 Tax=Compostimonas suwonensis TaxID=1048394 RepID=A0A2M9C3N1_9MICO|nr:FGGY family carbohydrate kinase [Compostimonas suwonensis]PJJ65150.1 xylulokinase [Compostimonas suwonensis]
MTVFLGIDVGTTTVKASIVDDQAHVLAEASIGYPTSFVRTSWVEQDPQAWWTATLTVLARLASEAGREVMAAVAGISVSSQAPTLLALDAAGSPVRPALIWMDRRAEAQCDALAAEFGRDEYLAVTGNRIDPFFVAPKLLWLSENEPASLRRTAAFVQINGYIVFRLTGALSMDEQHASLLGLRDIHSGEWSQPLLAATGVRAELFPAISAASDVVGHVTPAVAAETGLRSGTPVVAGTVDSAAAALEAGVVRPGQGAEMTGTSTVVTLPVESPLPQAEFITMASALHGQWLYLAAMVATGASLTWLRTLTAPGADFAELTRDAAQLRAGAGGLVFLPYMMGERSPLWNTAARGMFLGLTLSTDVPQLTRAVLEGTAFALRHNLDVAQGLGVRPAELRSTGGPAGNDLWCQIKADVTGIPIVRMHAPTGATFGDAMIAAAGTGHLDDLAAAVDENATIDRVFDPNDRDAQRYDELFDVYRNSYEHLRGDLDVLARLSTPEATE